MPKVVTLSDYATNNCPKLEGDLVLNDLKTLGRNNLMNCNITSIKIPNVETIGIYSLRDNKQLKTIEIGDKLTTIGSESIINNTSLEHIIIRSITPPSVGSYVFNKCDNCIFYVPDGSVEAYKTASGWSSYADRINPLSEYVES